jgi:hypothetical protein
MQCEITLGYTFRLGEQEYECVGFRDHITRFGQQIALAVLRSHCPECGAAFEFTSTKTRVRQREVIRRRCDAHKRPGAPVSDGRKRKRQRRRRQIARLYAAAARYRAAGDEDNAAYFETVADREEADLLLADEAR